MNKLMLYESITIAAIIVLCAIGPIIGITMEVFTFIQHAHLQ